MSLRIQAQPLVPSSENHGSVGAKRDHRIDARSTAGGQIAGNQRDNRENRGHRLRRSADPRAVTPNSRPDALRASNQDAPAPNARPMTVSRSVWPMI